MSTLILLGSLILFVVLYFTYGRFLDRKVVRSDSSREVPSRRFNDGVDYVPARRMVLFGHHFASIAGAAPIVGPVLAMAYGWLPGLMWIWVGNVFIGAVHDYLSLSASVRYDGKSIQFIAQQLLGKLTGKSFAWFILFLCVLVIAAFAAVVGKLFVASPAAASSFVFLILAALILGFLLYRTKLPFWLSSVFGIFLLIASILLGRALPISISYDVWMLIFFGYIIIASSIPVTVLLQPRDYLNSFLLYFGLFVGSLAAVLGLASFSAPALSDFSVTLFQGQATPFWPAIPLIIACGSLSGFHSLVASGTSSKQLASEKDSLFIGYGSMFTEGMLSTLAVVAVGAFGMFALRSTWSQGLLPPLLGQLADFGTWSKEYIPVINEKSIGGAASFFVLSFSSMTSSILGIPFLLLKIISGMWVASFAMTTLDTTNRLARYIVSELADPLERFSRGMHRFFTNRWVASSIPAFIGIALAWTKSYTVLWPAFGAANQLLASITMITVSAWIYKKLDRRHVSYALIPGILLWLTVTVAILWFLVEVVPVYISSNPLQGYVVAAIMVIMVILNFVLLASFFRNFRRPDAAAAGTQD